MSPITDHKEVSTSMRSDAAPHTAPFKGRTLSDEIAGGLFSRAASVPRDLRLDSCTPRDANGAHTARKLLSIVNLVCHSGRPDEPFFYLGGPMTGIPQFNFPEFHRIAGKLREGGLNIVSPAELDEPDTEAAALASEDGAPGSGAANGESYEDFLSRDIIIVSLPTCVGGIFMEGWHNSRGARGESWVLAYLKKQLLAYGEDDGKPQLTAFERDATLRGLGIPDYAAGSVPRDKPGMLTAQQRAEEADDIEAAQKAIREHVDPPQPLSLDPLGEQRRARELPTPDLGTLEPPVGAQTERMSCTKPNLAQVRPTREDFKRSADRLDGDIA